ncbi:hypothetical protein OEA41_004694 [Lepraria neglecta]|uniref:ATPase AAA-type core domain-containing protein n=1 Tax=Lepraria neglecta TaxID=209136 RepID=A0AAD9Z2H2_9LECA|nr:hypothetical protein OEA41_004694 [Lepraria neglecta]
MAHCRVCAHPVLEQPRLFCPRNQKFLLRSIVAKNIFLAASPERIQQACDSDPYLDVVKELRSHFSKSGILTNIGIVDLLRRWHPNHTVTQTPKSTGILKLAKAGQAHASLDTGIDFYGSRTYERATDDAKGIGPVTQHLSEIKEEIWVYDRGYWRKNHKLWNNVQGCKWENVILANEMKLQLISDIEGFLDRKEDYKSFAVPWKRGIILHGLPENGKTISIKALMRSLASRSTPIPTLYVKSLGKSCDQDDIRSIFEKARETGPCLLVFEDIDSLMSDEVKSFFLNEVDGLEGNDGIMMIKAVKELIS